MLLQFGVFMQVIIHILAFIIAISLLILVHEYGHFIVACWCKVKVKRFSIGFGKPWCRWYSKKYATEFVLAPFLLGGYIKLLDTREMPVPNSQKRYAFDRQPFYKRFAIIAAGPLANIIFALFAFTLMFVIGVKTPRPIIGKIVPNSVASTLGMHSGEQIIKIDHKRTPDWQEIIIAILAKVGNKGPMVITTQASTQEVSRDYVYNYPILSLNPVNPDPLKDLGIEPYRPHIAPVIHAVLANSVAAKAGLRVGDQVIKVDQQPIDNWYDLIKYIQERPQHKITLLITRQQQRINITVTPEKKLGMSWKKYGYLGISSLLPQWPEEMQLEKKLALFPAIKEACHQIWLYAYFNGFVLGKLFMGKLSLHILGGPIAIFVASGQAWQQGFAFFLSFLAIISLTLALINFLPLPGLDGANCLIALIEGAMRRTLSVRVQVLLFRVGMIIFLLLMVQATINDILRIFL